MRLLVPIAASVLLVAPATADDMDSTTTRTTTTTVTSTVKMTTTEVIAATSTLQTSGIDEAGPSSETGYKWFNNIPGLDSSTATAPVPSAAETFSWTIPGSGKPGSFPEGATYNVSSDSAFTPWRPSSSTPTTEVDATPSSESHSRSLHNWEPTDIYPPLTSQYQSPTPMPQATVSLFNVRPSANGTTVAATYLGGVVSTDGDNTIFEINALITGTATLHAPHPVTVTQGPHTFIRADTPAADANHTVPHHNSHQGRQKPASTLSCNLKEQGPECVQIMALGKPCASEIAMFGDFMPATVTATATYAPTDVVWDALIVTAGVEKLGNCTTSVSSTERPSETVSEQPSPSEPARQTTRPQDGDSLAAEGKTPWRAPAAGLVALGVAMIML